MPILLPEDMERRPPPMYRVRQQFDDAHLDTVEGAVYQELARPEIRRRVRPGSRVAVAVGSRGIQNLALIVDSVLRGLKACGARPFIVSAMGSHGGGTERGQREILAGYGITEERMGVPVVSTVDTVSLGHCANGRPVWFDRVAYEADMIVPINRVKLHTDFSGPIQSGLCKMLVIGLGNHKGCSAVHEEAPENFSAALEETATKILAAAPVGFGVAVLENAYDQTFRIEAVPAEDMIAREKALLQEAKVRMPYILLPEADVLICDEIGKNISGAGFDPHILGRSSLLRDVALPHPNYQKAVLGGVSRESHGNGLGIGLFDVVTRAAVKGLDREAMYANAIASNCLPDVSIPMTVEDLPTAVRVALKCCRGIDRDAPRILRIRNTLSLAEISVSEALLPAVEREPRLHLLGPEEQPLA